MTARVAEIYRHPLKAIGREALETVQLAPGEVLPWDRAFAIAHEKSRPEDLAKPWAKKMNFLRGVTGPDLMAVSCTFDPETLYLRLRHPRLADLNICLSKPQDEASLIEWLSQIWPAEAPAPTHLIHHKGSAQTDVPEPWVALNSLASHRQVAEKLSAPDFSIHRWRGNIWVEGLEPWTEFDWIGRSIHIGAAVLNIQQPITRCKATMANPETGQRDLDTLGALEAGWDHADFGVYAEVIKGGSIKPGDAIEVI
ncbi:MAG: hypothetical protein ACI9KS_000501 [Sulfitobacter sp.]|jgi:uncharacterized protein YcbX